MRPNWTPTPLALDLSWVSYLSRMPFQSSTEAMVECEEVQEVCWRIYSRRGSADPAELRSQEAVVS